MEDPPYTSPTSQPGTTSPIDPGSVPTSGLAIASLVCGIGGLLTSFLTGIPAIITGHMAMSRIKASQGAIKGHGMALAGTILGYITTFLIGCIAVLAGLATPAILKAKKNADKAKLTVELREVGMVLMDHADTNSRYPTPIEFEANFTLPLVKNHVDRDWLYFSETDPNEVSPLLVSPIIENNSTTLILWSDLSVSEEKERDTTRILSEIQEKPHSVQVTLFKKD